MPPGVVIFEDPPTHTIHRSLMSRVFTPRKVRGAGAADPRAVRRVPRPARRHRALRLRHRPRRPDADAGDRHAPRHPRRGPGVGPRPHRRQPAHGGGQADGGRGRLRQRRALRRVHRLARRAPVRRHHDRPPQRRVRGRDRHRPAPAPRRAPHLPVGGGRRRERDHHQAHRVDRQGAGRPSGPAAPAGGRPLPPPQRHRGAPALRGARAAHRALHLAATSSSTARRCPRAARCSSSPGRPTATTASSPTATGSTSTATRAATSPSATARTSASAPRWPASRAAWRSTRCCSASRSGRSTRTRAKLTPTSTVRGWETLPVVIP